MVKIGQRFKFVLDEGKDYAISNRYAQIDDGWGNLNNIF